MKISPVEAVRAIVAGGQFRSPQQIARLTNIVLDALSSAGSSDELAAVKAQLVSAQDEVEALRAEMEELTAAHAACAAEIKTLKAAAAKPKTTRRTRKKSTPKTSE